MAIRPVGEDRQALSKVADQGALALLPDADLCAEHALALSRRDGPGSVAAVVVAGPAILEQSDTTIFIDPGLSAEVDSYGNLVVKPDA